MAPSNSQQSVIEGILFEGVDFVGKTTAAALLAEQLRGEGRRVHKGKCYIERGPLIEFLEEQAQKRSTMIERDYFYSACIVLDLWHRPPSGSFVVQDRHWLTQIGRNRFFHPDRALIPEGFLEKNHVPFRYNVLLTSSLDAKLERCGARAPSSPRDAVLVANPELHQEYEHSLIELIPENENWEILDTTFLDPPTVIAVLRARLEI